MAAILACSYGIRAPEQLFAAQSEAPQQRIIQRSFLEQLFLVGACLFQQTANPFRGDVAAVFPPYFHRNERENDGGRMMSELQEVAVEPIKEALQDGRIFRIGLERSGVERPGAIILFAPEFHVTLNLATESVRQAR